MQSGTTPDIADPYRDIIPPTAQEQELHLQQMVEQGIIKPEEAATILQQQSELNNITLDPNLKRNQMDALLGLQDISDSGGHTAMDDANLARITSQEDAAAKGKRAAIMQGAEARGMGGSGLQLMDQLQNEQDSATRKSQRDLDVAGQSKQRALEALMQAGQLSGNMQNQDFNQQAQVAGANDAISNFNARNQQAQINQNVGARNAAQEKNLATKQGISNANTEMSNKQQQYNKSMLDKAFQQKMQKAGGTYTVANQNAANSGVDSRADADAANKTTDKFFNVAGAMAMSDENQKTDVEKFDSSEFLDNLTGKKYKYKDPKFGQGQQVGVMAQDLEKSEAGNQMVSDSPEGKMVDFSKSGPPILASLADINERLKRIEGGV